MPELEIQLRDVMLYARHGVLPEEFVTGNQYRVNVRLRIDASAYDESKDEIGMTISYADVFYLLKKIMSESSALLETVAIKFGKQVLMQWPNIKGGEIEIVKTVPPIPEMIGEAGVKYCF